MDLTNGIKKAFLASVGAVATTAEVTKDIVEKMIEGGLRKYLDEVTLLRQPYVMDNEKKVGDVLKSEGVKVLGFKRLEVGEGIEKKQEDFAAEVAATQAANK